MLNSYRDTLNAVLAGLIRINEGGEALSRATADLTSALSNLDDAINEGRWFVHLYLIDRAYGGPEEGGWYYDTGEPQEDMYNTSFDNEVQARAYARALHVRLNELNAGLPEISSVLSRGRYEYQVWQGPPKPYPEVKPHYE